MWRSFFMAVAVTLIILGFECMVLNKAVMAKTMLDVPGSAGYEYWDDPLLDSADSGVVHKTIVPPEWAPWSLLSAGAVMLLYTASMNRPE